MDSRKIVRGMAGTSGGQVHYRRVGEGAPVVILHRTPGSSRLYEPLLTSLAAAGHAAYAPDLPGFGCSDPMPRDLDMAGLASIIVEFAQAVGLSQFALMGNNLCCHLAVELAAGHPELISRLVLDHIYDEPPEQYAERARQQAAQLLPGQSSTSPRAQAWDRAVHVCEMWRGGYDPSSAEDIDFARQLAIEILLSAPSNPLFLQAVASVAPRERLKAVQAPVLCIAVGEGQPPAPAWVDAIADVRTQILPGPAVPEPLFNPKTLPEYAQAIHHFLIA